MPKARRTSLRLKVKELANDPEFKASLGWYQNWKRRHSISVRTKTTLAQRLPHDLENKILQFHHFVIAARQRMQYPLEKIFNMDETPMRFELPSSPPLIQKSITKLQYNLYIRSAYMWINANFLMLEKVLFSENSRL